MANESQTTRSRGDRRDFLRKAAASGAVAGGAWAIPTILPTPAGAQTGSEICGDGTTDNGFFTWNRTEYASGERSGAPGSATQMDTPTGWTLHPTYPTLPGVSGGTPTAVRIGYFLQNTTYLNDNGTAGETHGVSNAGTSASYKSYRVSKDGVGTATNPPVDDVLTIVIRFARVVSNVEVPTLVSCPRVTIGDIDNCLPSTLSMGPGYSCNSSGVSPNVFCPPAGGPNPPVPNPAGAWGDHLAASAWTAWGGGSSRPVTAISQGTNLQALGPNGPWVPIGCAGIPQDDSPAEVRSDLTLRVSGAVSEIRLSYRSTVFDSRTGGNGRQHIALGNIQFRI